MDNDKVSSLLKNLSNLLKESNKNDESLEVMIEAIDSGDERIYHPGFLMMCADEYDSFLYFDEAQFLYETADAIDKDSHVLDRDDREELHKNLKNIANEGYRKFNQLLKSEQVNEDNQLIDELKAIIKNGYEAAEIWYWIGGISANLGKTEESQEAFQKCLEIDNKTRELSGDMRQKAQKQLKNDSGKGCFIATAVYGSFSAPEVVILRKFRDEVLLQSKLGKVFVKCYYFISPVLANYLKNKTAVKNWLKLYLLGPIVRLAESQILQSQYGRCSNTPDEK